MSRRMEYLRLRREFLSSLIEAQRTEVGYLAARLYPPLRALDAAAAMGRALKFYRAVALTGSALLARRGRGLWGLGAALTLWRLFAGWRDRRG
jgi:hypothetical protein